MSVSWFSPIILLALAARMKGILCLLSKYVDSPLHPEKFSKKRPQWGHCFFLASVLDTITSLFCNAPSGEAGGSASRALKLSNCDSDICLRAYWNHEFLNSDGSYIKNPFCQPSRPECDLRSYVRPRIVLMHMHT